VLDFLRKDDVLMVTRIDRLARSIGDLQDIVRAVRAKGASLKATEQPIDTSTAAGKCFLDMLGVFAEFETNLRRERQLEGIAKAKAAGVYKGRPASIDVTKVRQLKAKGMGASEIAKALKIGRASVYRVLGEFRRQHRRPRFFPHAEMADICVGSPLARFDASHRLSKPSAVALRPCTASRLSGRALAARPRPAVVPAARRGQPGLRPGRCVPAAGRRA